MFPAAGEAIPSSRGRRKTRYVMQEAE